MSWEVVERMAIYHEEGMYALATSDPLGGDQRSRHRRRHTGRAMSPAFENPRESVR